MPSSNSYVPKKEESSSQDCLFVSYEVGKKRKYALIGVDNEYIPLTSPVSLSKLRKQLTLSSDKEWLGFFEFPDHEASDVAIKMVVLWNLTRRESVNFILAKPPNGFERTVIGFGVSRNASLPKVVKICVNRESRLWVVDVFTLSKNLTENKIEGVWKRVKEYDESSAFENLIDLECSKVSANGVIYFRAYNEGSSNNIVISFDLDSEKFDKVPLPAELVAAPILKVAKVNESLAFLDYHDGVCDLWTIEEGANVFTLKHTIQSVREADVLECMKNGDIVIERDVGIEVYKPSSGDHSGVGINGTRYKSSARSYPITPLLTHEVTL